jgi:hypothetical protein
MALDVATRGPALYLRQAIGGSFVPACGVHHQMIKVAAQICTHLTKENFAK